MRAQPFTLRHFREWAKGLVLDTGEEWRLEPFQAAFVEDMFVGGFRECWLVVPEGNTKTTLLAGIGLYHCQHLPSASVPVAASSRDQAEVLFRQAEGFVLRSVPLRGVFKAQEGYRRVKHLALGSRMQVFAADDRTGDGVIPTLALLDELHRHRDLRLYRTWRGKLDKRGGQIAAISTAGEPGSEFEETRELILADAVEVRRRRAFTRAAGSGVVLHDWAVPAGASVEDMREVKAANPFSGVTVSLLRQKRSSPTMTLAHWERFVCNRATRAVVSAVTEAEWWGARRPGVEDLPEGEPCWLGLDVAWKWDTTALVPMLVESRERRLLGPATILEPPRDGTSLRPELVEAALLERHERNPIHTVVMDMSRAEQLAVWIEDELGSVVIDRGQSNGPAVDDHDAFMEALREGWLEHCGDRGLAEHVLNAVARMLPQGDMRFDRPSSSRAGGGQRRRVIDALSAAAMVNFVAGGSADVPFLILAGGSEEAT